MNLTECPYCNLPGLVTTVKTGAGGLDVSGYCTICGYRCDSAHEPAGLGAADDLPDEFTRPAEIVAAD
jgi:hypothetical protein